MPRLNWLGRDAVVNHHFDVPFHFLDRKYGAGRNMIIHGDNLLALKSLLPKFEQKIKCIYIDPPYNTGNEGWVYNDNVNDPEIRKWLGEVVGREGEDFTRHDKWLCMMYPRLRLLQRLLSDDGAIFISIDDNEQANLKLICNEIFGERNFISTIIWEKRYSPQNAVKYFSESHDFIIVYAKNKSIWRPNLLPRTEKMNARYKNPDNDPRGPWLADNPTAQAGHGTASQFYVLHAPNGRDYTLPSGRCWLYTEKKMFEAIADNRIWFGKTGLSSPSVKRFLSEVKQGIAARTIWSKDDVGDNQESKREIKNIFRGENVFDTPKPVRLIEKILRLSTDSNALVLDCFAGSGTTAHAVINLNRADGGNRRFILIEQQDYAESIIAARVRRISPTTEFGYYELGARLFDDDELLNPDVSLEQLREYVYFGNTRKSLPPPSDHKYLLGIEEGTAYYFCFERDRELILTPGFVRSMLGDGAEYRVVYSSKTNCGDKFLKDNRIEFRRIPSDILRI